MNIHVQKRNEGGSGSGWRLPGRVGSRRFRQASVFLVACWLCLNPATALSLNEETIEYPLKLACLYNFTKFVEWPASSYRNPEASLAICIVGDDPFSPKLEGELSTRSVGGHPVEVRTLKLKDSLSACHIVFVPVTEKNQATRILSGLRGSSTLTVGESEGFAAMGGIINLTVEGNMLHFEVNALAAERAGLKISSKFLSMAKIVNEQGHPGKN
jgi:hypothetical protein